MPRRDGTGPLGNGPMGRGRGNCQGTFLGCNMRRFFGFGSNNTMNQKSLEVQAAHLEEQAANLRNIAKQNRKAE
ncbi:DUF5320 domain-containing protein [Pelosinus baikalensis]|uniref:DUF5320 domain-containing protein n=1 Tax=Pelosinus baikalensis TaxID=2892015 RepID=A0ABS8HSZ9_9FIRM|nr:DUF5320 domain-containing protein [Pelosinus baikalensis]MCC5466306.1 DUF5320 domain-containing protein [Pelosinus baikalensis]